MEPDTLNSPAQNVGMNLSKPMLIGGALLVVLILGAIFMWQGGDTMIQTASNVDRETWQPAQNDSDEAAAIQAELESANMAEFEQNMNADADAAASGI